MLPGQTTRRSNQFGPQGASQLGRWLDAAWRVLPNGLAELPYRMALPRQPPLGAGVAGVNRKSDSKKGERLALYISAQRPIFTVENGPENWKLGLALPEMPVSGGWWGFWRADFGVFGLILILKNRFFSMGCCASSSHFLLLFIWTQGNLKQREVAFWW